MVLKRAFGQEGEKDDGPSAPGTSKRPRPFLNSMREVVLAQSMQRHLSKLEPYFRRVVQEEVQEALCRYAQSAAPRLSINQTEATVTRPYRLSFQGRLPQTLFTGSRIEAENKLPIQIVIKDTNLNKIITTGPLSTLKIEIVVVDGDFGGDGQEVWTEEGFTAAVVREREGKRPLLTGELVVTLNNGVGYLGELTFTDNSSWIRSRKFRLGARVFQSRCSEGSVHETLTEAFLVKDHRGELYKKHHPPALVDEIWRLEKIGKDGAFHKRLSESGIHNVQDFLRCLVLDQDRLRTLLGIGMSNKIWEAIVDHARECVLDDKRYSYSSGEGVVVLFNSIFQPIGATFDNKIYHSIYDLTASQKVLVNKFKDLAFRNPNNIVEFNEQLVSSPPMLLQTIGAVSSYQGTSVRGLCNPDRLALHLDAPTTHLGFQHQPHGTYSEIILGDPSPLKNMLTCQGSSSLQHFDSFGTNSLSVSDLVSGYLGNFPVNGLAGSTYEQLVRFNPGVDLPSSSLPVPWDHGGTTGSDREPSRSCIPCSSSCGAHMRPLPAEWDNTNGMMQAMGCEARRFFPGSRVSSCNWVKVMAALKWKAISKRLAARRTRIAGPGCPIMVSNMYADAQVNWW